MTSLNTNYFVTELFNLQNGTTNNVFITFVFLKLIVYVRSSVKCNTHLINICKVLCDIMIILFTVHHISEILMKLKCFCLTTYIFDNHVVG